MKLCGDYWLPPGKKPIGKILKKPLLGSLVGLLGGGGIAGLKYLLSKERAEEKGRILGEAVQFGKLPDVLPSRLPSSLLYSLAQGFQPGLEKDISPKEYKELRRKIKEHLSPIYIQKGMGYGTAGGLGWGALSNIPGSMLMGSMFGPLVGAGIGKRIGEPVASRKAEKLLDLYHRGYGDLADKLLAKALRE